MNPRCVLMAPDYRRHNPYQGLLAEALAARGVTVVFLKGYRRVLPLWRGIRDFPERIDALHLHWQEAYVRSHSAIGSVVYMLKLLLDLNCVKLGRRRVIWTVHNDLPHEARYPRLHAAFQWALCRTADVVIFHSKSAVDQLQRRLRLPEQKIRVIPHGHYLDYYGPRLSRLEARARLGLPEAGLVYLHLGMLRPYKGIEDLLEAWRQVASEIDGAHLLIAGEPLNEEYEQLLRARAAESPRTLVRFGFVPRADVAAYFSAADFAVLPFRRSLTSGSLLLAMSYQVPVIAPALPFTREFAAHEYLYDPRDEAALAKVLSRSSRLAPKPAASAADVGVTRFDWHTIAAATAECYENQEISLGSPAALEDFSGRSR